MPYYAKRAAMPCRLGSLPYLLPLYSTLKRKAGQALAWLACPGGPWCAGTLAEALGMSVQHVTLLERWALLPKGLPRQEVLLWLEGLAAMGETRR